MGANTFVRVPSELLEAFLRVRLTETGWRIVLWVVRQSYGWHRLSAPYSWYRIARDLSVDRGGVVRTGKRLLQVKVLFIREGRLGVQDDYREWDRTIFNCQRDHGGQLWMPGLGADRRQRKAMTAIIASDDACPRNRCQASAVYRRAKDSSKDKLKIYKDKPLRRNDGAGDNAPYSINAERRLLAGAARPIPGKYDRISQ